MNADARYIQQAASDLELEVVPGYSGRGMLGRTCIAVQLTAFTQIGRIMFNLGAINQDPDINDMTEMVMDWRYESLGKNGWILYWPHIEAPEAE